VVLIPVLVLLFRTIYRHYEKIDQQLQLRSIGPVGECRSNTVVIPVTRLHPGVAAALEFAKCLSRDVHAVYVEIDPAQTPALRAEWGKLQTDVPIEVVPSPYRSWVGVLLNYISEIRARHANELVTVILPEFVPSVWWQELLHNQAIFRLKASLLFRPGIVVVSVPYLLR
jgi:hypothetical protein